MTTATSQQKIRTWIVPGTNMKVWSKVSYLYALQQGLNRLETARPKHAQDAASFKLSDKERAQAAGDELRCERTIRICRKELERVTRQEEELLTARLAMAAAKEIASAGTKTVKPEESRRQHRAAQVILKASPL